ncbi:MAG: signal peptide protein [Bdellovibrio sp. ArHS]|uniref:PepSY domain-containing protein n=1 Tax=Bdellovibrio sp. ArHS TaxID=1569284 RepID=UPI0005833EC9|nr:PepSY domain-containing protein [Bdellovibrio sp. ArHS]KHD87015.1 MAG: signal peptide protein [Bdellovibrio sp. ArHS]
MKQVVFALMVVMLGTGVAHAKKSCTDQPKEKWMKEEDFKKRMEGEGYKIRKFKQPGTCYEIYGTNKEGKNVEIYFNPVDASIVKENIE